MRRLVAVGALALLVACGDDDGGDGDSAASVVSIAAGASATSATSATSDSSDDDVDNPALREELLAMMDEDQAEQMGRVTTNNFEARTARLQEILDEYGWPGFRMVGSDGSTAAWVIAQHADTYPELQQQALELLREAVAGGQASPGDLAYLEDRVAVANGADQLYGTQISCDAGLGPPVPATPIVDEANVDERRAEAGLPPIAEYYAEMQEVCAPPD